MGEEIVAERREWRKKIIEQFNKLFKERLGTMSDEEKENFPKQFKAHDTRFPQLWKHEKGKDVTADTGGQGYSTHWHNDMTTSYYPKGTHGLLVCTKRAEKGGEFRILGSKAEDEVFTKRKAMWRLFDGLTRRTDSGRMYCETQKHEMVKEKVS